MIGLLGLGVVLVNLKITVVRLHQLAFLSKIMLHLGIRKAVLCLRN